MKILKIDNRDIFLDKLLEIWEDFVKTTHLFLSIDKIQNIKKYVYQWLMSVSHLIVLEKSDNLPIAFMEIEDKKLEMLFIKNSERGRGYGRQLLTYGIEKYGICKLIVNEQNPEAKGFYEHMCFKIYKK